MAETTITQEIATIPVEDFVALAEKAPEALKLNTALMVKAIDKSERLRELVKAGAMDDDLDEQLKEFIVNSGIAKDKCNGRRSPFTQMLSRVVKSFTGIENWFDSEKDYFQKVRDQYAQKKVAEQKERDRLAQLELAKAKERVEVKIKLEADFNSHLQKQIATVRDKMFYQFDRISLDNYAEAAKYYKALKFPYTQADFDSWTSFTGSRILSDDEIIAMQREVKEGKFEASRDAFVNELTATLQEILDKLPGKKKELDEIAAAKGKEAERLRAEAEARAKKDAEERARREAEAKAKADADAAAKKDVAIAETLFDHEAKNAQLAPEAPKGREGFEITVNAVPGFMLIFNLWYQYEGKTLTVDQFSKKKVESMVSFCEKHAMKTGEKIDSPLITYTEIFKASNRV